MNCLIHPGTDLSTGITTSPEEDEDSLGDAETTPMAEQTTITTEESLSTTMEKHAWSSTSIANQETSQG